MALGWNEIRNRALGFSKEYEVETRERAESQTFWNDFFAIFGISRRRVATFAEGVKKLSGNTGEVDLFWPGRLLVEHKTALKNLDKAYGQAIEYTIGLSEGEMPTHIVVSDFQRFRVYNLDAPEETRMREFSLKDLYKNIRYFGFMLGYQEVAVKAEDPVNQKAVKAVAKLHDALKEAGYSGHELEVLLVRLVYCFFADDTGIFDDVDTFRSYLLHRTNEDGSDTGSRLNQIFDVLNTPIAKRQTTLEEELAKLPYIDGPLFQERVTIPSFNSEMRETLLGCALFDWGKVSPVIFGSMFQSVMDQKQRDQLGAHYTSEANIFKVIDSLFLDVLKEDLENAGKNRPKLNAFLKRLRGLKFLDPACGCGNFLVVTYRELRRLELEALKRIYSSQEKTQMSAVSFGAIAQVNVDQFYGIEIEEFPARVAELALWLTDHQMNMELSEAFGESFKRLPLSTHPNIHHKNALRTDWNEVVTGKELSYILGNPPFSGKKEQSAGQKEDMKLVWADKKGSGVLDYVTCWYKKACDFIHDTRIPVAFVSTNSIIQGEQVGVLWPFLLDRGVKIHFAHRTFRWTNEAAGKAAVHCVIIGFGEFEISRKQLFDYEDTGGDPHRVDVSNINPYLVDASDIVVKASKKTLIHSAPKATYGSFALDDGNYTLSENERDQIIQQCPSAVRYLRDFVGGWELIHNEKRYCLWLLEANPEEIRSCPEIIRRVEAVRLWRLQSDRAATKKLAQTPYLFAEVRQPTEAYIAFPTVSSERRHYIPIAILDSKVIASNQIYVVPTADKFVFGVLTSGMHMAWVRSVCGRLKSDYRYSIAIVYNNFPWPQDPAVKLKGDVENFAQAVLDARKKHPTSTLADLYDPNTMPKDLHDAHVKLDRAVDACYGRRVFKTEMERLEMLFGLYQEYLNNQK